MNQDFIKGALSAQLSRVEKYCSVYHLAVNKPASLHIRIWHPAWLNAYLVYLINIKSKLQYYYSTSFPPMLTFSFYCLNKGCLYMFTPGVAGSWSLDMLEDHQYLAQFWWEVMIFRWQGFPWHTFSHIFSVAGPVLALLECSSFTVFYCFLNNLSSSY